MNYNQKKSYIKFIPLTHNQVVPGSSPGGTTFKALAKHAKAFLFLLKFKNQHYSIVLFLRI